MSKTLRICGTRFLKSDGCFQDLHLVIPLAGADGVALTLPMSCVSWQITVSHPKAADTESQLLERYIEKSLSTRIRLKVIYLFHPALIVWYLVFTLRKCVENRQEHCPHGAKTAERLIKLFVRVNLLHTGKTVAFVECGKVDCDTPWSLLSGTVLESLQGVRIIGRLLRPTLHYVLKQHHYSCASFLERLEVMMAIAHLRLSETYHVWSSSLEASSYLEILSASNVNC